MDRIDLSGQTAIVTGAGVAIGRSHALLLASRGAAVLVNDADADAADAVAMEICATGGIAVANYVPVGSREAGEEIVAAAIDAFGGLEIVINNAGNRFHNLFEDLSQAEIESVLAVHLMGSIYVTQAAWKGLKAQGYGRVIMTSSSSGMFSNPGVANYSAAKTGVYGLMKTLAFEGMDRNVLVNGLLPFTPDVGKRKPTIPGMAEAVRRFIDPELMARESRANTSPEMIAQMALYLASPACQLTGELFSICAGRFARVFVGVTDGWLSRPEDDVSAETIGAHIEEIRDLSAFSVPKWIFDEMRGVFERL